MTRPRSLAKLTCPRPHQAVARARLFAVIDESRRFPLIWLAAPPGAGKTTLVATYLEAGHVPALWYQVDPGDADPAAFFYYLGLAAAKFGAKSRLPLLAPEHLCDLPAFTRRFFRQLFSTLPNEAVLVLDNFQEAADADLAAIVRDACAEVPEGMNLLAISRVEPPPTFAELEARASLGVIGWDAVRLTLDETRAMSAVRGITEEWVVRALHQESGGWAAGVTLMLERLKRAGGGAGKLPSDTRESVFNYFAALIFDQASEIARQTLLSLAFLPRVTPTTAQALSGNADAGKLLESLRRRHLFIDRRPGTEPVYQFHALFAEFLRAKVAELLAPDSLRARLRSAGAALEQQGEWESAFELFLEAQAWDEAIALVLAHASALLSTGRWQTLSRWIEALPEAQRQCEPWLVYWLACARAETNPALAISTFERAHLWFSNRGERKGQVLSLAGLLHACSVDHTDYPTIDRWLDILAEELAARPPSLTPEEELNAWSALLSGAFYMRPWHLCIGPCLSHIESLLDTAGASGSALRAAASALAVASRSGDMERAERLAAVVNLLAGQDSRSPVERAWALFQLAHQRFLKADCEASLVCFDRTWALVEANGLKGVLTAALTFRFMVDYRLKERAAADESIRRIRALPPPTHAFSQGLLTCYEARYAQIRNEPQVAADLAERAHAKILCTGAGFHEICYGLVTGEILLVAGRVGKARLLIERSRALIERSEILSNFRASLALVEAWLAEQEGRRQDSLGLLREALERSQVGYNWCQMRFVDTTCAHMLRVALEKDIETEAAKRLIRIFRLRPREDDTEAWPWPLRVHTLGRFEVLADGRTLEFERKAPKKALALLKALVASGPREVPEQHLVDALWPDEEGDAGHKALSVTLLRLRRLLGDNQSIRQQGGRLSIDRQRCWVDAWAFEQRLAQTSLNGETTRDELRALGSALALYRGTFLPEDAGEPWAVPARERLRARFIHALGSFGGHLEASGRFDESIAWYLKGLDADAIVEPFYQGLMRCYDKLDRRTEAIGVYRRLRQTLSVTLGLQPSASTEKLYQALRVG